MRHHKTLPRLHHTFSAAQIQVCLTDDQAHYVATVMRLKPGSQLRLFNAGAGEWLAEVIEVKKKQVQLRLNEKLQEAWEEENLPSLAFAPVKKDAVDMIVEKAVELGVDQLIPLITEYTQVRKLNATRLQKTMFEAVEQSEQFALPDFLPVQTLSTFLAGNDRPILWACEWEDLPRQSLEMACKEACAGSKTPVFLVGPEGGFSPKERDQLAQNPQVMPISLGKSILRAETACLAMLACYRCCREKE